MTRIFAKERRPLSSAVAQVAIVLSLIASVLYGADMVPGDIMVGSLLLVTLVKGLSIALLAIFALVKADRGDVLTLFFALMACAAGDVLITGAFSSDGTQEAGLTSAIYAFGAGHVLYTLVFLTQLAPLHVLTAFRLRVAALVWAGAGFAVYWFWPVLTVQPWLVLVYAGLLFVMTSAACLTRYPFMMVGVGALLFMASDALLGAELFLGLDLSLAWLVWPLYYLGQFMLALGIVLTPRTMQPTGRYRFV